MSDGTPKLRVASKPKLACPRCGAQTIAEILYGYPAFGKELEEELEAGRIVLGGCVVWDEQPDVACTTCGLEFREDGRPVGEPEW